MQNREKVFPDIAISIDSCTSERIEQARKYH
ncbi:hypothetical protein HNR53_000632 [Bacillus benzoevorans]|uniref:Uncharacterized protein n=1 Tax=Bacillus benzoevorans TaxID=1456 RepID=A0A7X0LV88_9BACI|nr:hypothetical protein [Bacillus benzoevorans]